MFCLTASLETQIDDFQSKDVHVLTDTTDQTEHDDLADSDDPDGLSEVVGVLHLRDKARQGDLADEGVTDVQEGVHPRDESSAGERNGENQRLTTNLLSACIDVVGVRVVAGSAMFALCASKGRGKNDTDEGEESRRSTELRQGTERSRH